MHIMSINSLARQLKIEIFYLYYSRNDCSQGTTWHPSRKQMLHCIFIPGGKPVFKLKNSFVSQSLITHRKQKQFCFNLITNFKNNTYMSCRSQVKNPKTILQEEICSKQRPVNGQCLPKITIWLLGYCSCTILQYLQVIIVLV